MEDMPPPDGRADPPSPSGLPPPGRPYHPSSLVGGPGPPGPVGPGGMDPADLPPKKPLKKSRVDHTYHDYSQVDDVAELMGDAYTNESRDDFFPAKLHKILSAPSEYGGIIRWREHGRAWFVVDRDLLISSVLPKFFNHR